MIFDKRKMVKVLKLTTPYWVKRVKRYNHLLLCEAPKCWNIKQIVLTFKKYWIDYSLKTAKNSEKYNLL